MSLPSATASPPRQSGPSSNPHNRTPISDRRRPLLVACSAICLFLGSTGCHGVKVPGAKGLDLMSPSSVFFPSPKRNKSPYQMSDGSVPAESLSADGSISMESYQKIREAKAQNAVVLQVAGDSEPVRVLPLPEGEKSVFVSELLTQTGVLNKFGAVNAALYRPEPGSLTGVRMNIRFKKDGSIDPSCDFGLRPGDRIQVHPKKTTPLETLVNLALQR